jgi:hypothetical protein
MAKIYKISGYIIDVHDEYDEDYLRWLLANYAGLLEEHSQIECVDIGEWHDEHPLNHRNVDISEYEKYFTNAHWELCDECFGETVISHEWRCSNCGHVALRWSELVANIRGESYEKPYYNYCPNCMMKMEG